MPAGGHEKTRCESMINSGLLSFWLPDQGSNLDSSEPKSDVLPITPSGNHSLNWERKNSTFFIFKKNNFQILALRISFRDLIFSYNY